MVGATATYVLYLRQRSEFMRLEGWPVAAAQDVALAYFIAKAIFFERRGPVGFLLVMAIVSDAIAIASIAFWYPAASESWPVGVGLMTSAMLVAAGLGGPHVDRIWVYMVTRGVLSWLGCYWGGIEPALALVPVVPFLPRRPRHVGPSAEAQRTMRRRFEHIFKYAVQVVLLFYVVDAANLSRPGAPNHRPDLGLHRKPDGCHRDRRRRRLAVMRGGERWI